MTKRRCGRNMRIGGHDGVRIPDAGMCMESEAGVPYRRVWRRAAVEHDEHAEEGWE